MPLEQEAELSSADLQVGRRQDREQQESGQRGGCLGMEEEGWLLRALSAEEPDSGPNRCSGNIAAPLPGQRDRRLAQWAPHTDVHTAEATELGTSEPEKEIWLDVGQPRHW